MRVTGTAGPPADDTGTPAVGDTDGALPEVSGVLVDGSTMVMVISGEGAVAIVTAGVGPGVGVNAAGAEEVHPAIATPRPTMMRSITAYA